MMRRHASHGDNHPRLDISPVDSTGARNVVLIADGSSDAGLVRAGRGWDEGNSPSSTYRRTALPCHPAPTGPLVGETDVLPSAAFAYARFGSRFGEPAAPFGLAPASRSVGDTVQRLRDQDELDLGPYELSLIHGLRPVAPMRPSAKWTGRVEQACLGAAAAIVVLLTAGTQGWLS